jgi:phage/plasmid-associated DNA primase
LKKICNDDDTLLNFKLSWSGYCLTGHTKEQKSLWEIGYSASNGKSTFAKIFMSCFNKYCYKMNREALETGYSKIHKELSQTKGIRFVVIEELQRKKLNESLYKDLVDGDKLNNEVLYSTTEEIKIKFKLDIITNNDPNFNNDNGMVRRGILINFTNRFIDKEEYDKIKSQKESLKGIYVKDKTLLEKFDDVKYKLAFFHLLLDYSKQYYKLGLIIPEILLDNFKGLCDENDKMKSFIETNFEKTNNKNDFIYKDEFLSLYNNYTKYNNKWTSVLNDIKRLDIKYDSVKHAYYESKRVQGCILGLKLKDKVINDEITTNSPFDINYKKDDLQEKLNEALKEIEYLKSQLKLKDTIQINSVNNNDVSIANDFDYKDDFDDDCDLKEHNFILDESEFKPVDNQIEKIVEPKKTKVLKKTTKRKNTNNITNNKVKVEDCKYTEEEITSFRENPTEIIGLDLKVMLDHFK